ncbi:hypothetical protein ACFL14_00180 [Patescibacteria group bacterium]
MDQNPLQNMSDEELKQAKKKFEDKLFSDLGLMNLSEEEKKKFVDDIADKANETILNTLIVNLDEAKADEIDKKIKTAKNDEEKATIFLEAAQTIPGIQGKITTALDQLYKQLIQASKDYDKENK